MKQLTTKLGKLALHNPITVASGTFGTEYFDFYPQSTLGAYVSKTITMHAKEGNPPPRLWETEAGMINSIGLQNPGLDAFIKEVLPILREKLEIPLIVSFSGSSEHEFCCMLEILERQSGIDGYEVNVSCPNVEREGIAFGVEPDVLYSLSSKLSALTQRELIIKLSPNVSDIGVLAKAAEAGGATSIALINTLFGMAVDWRSGVSRIRRGIGGYSGIGIKPVALALTYKAAQSVSIPILAMGGIYSWMDAVEFFRVGASAIAIGTANFTDPMAPVKLLQGLGEFMIYEDTSLDRIIGSVSFS